MNIEEKNTGGLLLINILERDANLAISEEFKIIMSKHIASGELKLVVSFKSVSYLDSSFLGALVSILKNLIPLQGKLILIHLNEDISSLFELTRLDKVFIIKDSLEEALKEFK